jgi:RNA polymerase sigma-70 factor, ECF subfamily
MNFRDIYDEHFAFVWRSLRRLGILEADVPDAVQDVFLVVHRRLAEFEGRSKMSTWIYGICYRIASDRRKAARVVRFTSADEQFYNTPDDRVDIAAEAEHRQNLQKLDLLLDEMPLEQRAVFTLFELECLTGEDISQTLDVPLGTVYSRLRLARETFRRSATRIQARERSQVAPLTTEVAPPRSLAAGGKR